MMNIFFLPYQRSSRRRESRKVREVEISDRSSMVESLEDLTKDLRSECVYFVWKGYLKD